MSIAIFLLVGLILFVPQACVAQNIPFYDNFEDGDWVGWDIGGRRQGTGYVDIVERNGSKMGHVYHRDFTEITLQKSFLFDPNLHFEFDMEAQALGGGGSSSDFYAMAGVTFNFKDIDGGNLGWTGYLNSTSTFPFQRHPSLNRIGSGLEHYSLDIIGDLIERTTIDRNEIATFDMAFYSYASGWPYSMRGNVWVDNVMVTPEPISSVLFLSGGAALFLRFRRTRKRNA